MKVIYPVKTIAYEGVKNVDALRAEQPLQIGLMEKNTAVFSGKSYVILDFSKELSAGIRILVHRVNGEGKVRLRFGESVTETCAELGFKGASNDHSNRDFTADLQDYSDMTFGGSGFRFLRLDVLGENSEITVKSIVAVSDADERKEIGCFECDDERINEIWKTAAYTLRLCLHNGFFWDGIKRDRLVWIGDLHPEMKSAFALYADVPEAKNSLVFSENETKLPDWINGIPMYSFWWLIILCDDYTHGGDREFVKARLPYAKSILSQIDEYIDESGETHFPVNFIDWPTHYTEEDGEEKKRDEYAGVHYLLKIAAEKMLRLLNEFGEETAKCRRILEKLFRKSFKVGKYKQIAALGVLAGEKTEHNREILLADGAKGFSTFMSYSILSAMAAYGEYESALSALKEYYGGMLDLGATSFWEDFDVTWKENAFRIDELPVAGKKDVHGDYGAFCYKGFRHSFCHGWASRVVAYLSEKVLGIEPEGVGCKKFRIRPHLDGLNRVKGAYPTPYGTLYVEHHIKDGKTETMVRAPEEIEILY